MFRSLYVHRIKPSGIDMVPLALQEDELIIGWTGIPQLLDSSLDRDDFRRLLSETYYPDARTLGKAGSAAGNMWRFIREMRVGDVVLVPHKKCFYVAEVVGDPTHDPAVDEGGFRRKVRWLNGKKAVGWREQPALYSVLLERKTCYRVNRPSQSEIYRLAFAYVNDVIADLDEISSRSDIGPTTKELLVKARIGQGKFREDLLSSWDKVCAVTGCSELRAIRASHAKRWADSTDVERLDPNNGLPLVGSLDALFDAGLIAFADDGDMLVSDLVTKSDRRILGVPCGLRRRPTEKQAVFLRHHRLRFF